MKSNGTVIVTTKYARTAPVTRTLSTSQNSTDGESTTYLLAANKFSDGGYTIKLHAINIVAQNLRNKLYAPDETARRAIVLRMSYRVFINTFSGPDSSRKFDLVAMLEADDKPMMIITDMSLSGMEPSTRTLMEVIA
jgi:hypothetical protein